MCEPVLAGLALPRASLPVGSPLPAVLGSIPMKGMQKEASLCWPCGQRGAEQRYPCWAVCWRGVVGGEQQHPRDAAFFLRDGEQRDAWGRRQ